MSPSGCSTDCTECRFMLISIGPTPAGCSDCYEPKRASVILYHLDKLLNFEFAFYVLQGLSVLDLRSHLCGAATKTSQSTRWYVRYSAILDHDKPSIVNSNQSACFTSPPARKQTESCQDVVKVVEPSFLASVYGTNSASHGFLCVLILSMVFRAHSCVMLRRT